MDDDIMKPHDSHFVKAPTTTSVQLKTTSTAVGFDTIMTVYTHHPTQELFPSYSEPGEQCTLTQS